MNYCFSFVKMQQKEQLEKATSKSYFSNKKLSFLTLENAYVLPHQGSKFAGVAMHDFTFLPSTGLDGNEHRLFSGEGAVFRNETVIYLGCFHWVWGHYLTDNIKRLWFLHTEEGKKLVDEGAKLVYTCVCNKEISGNGLQIMRMADVEPSSFELITTPTCFSKVYVPDSSLINSEDSVDSLGCRYYSREFLQTISRIQQKIRINRKVEKVYFSRTGIVENYLREYGEWNVENIFRRKGYEIIRPETIPLEEQLSILNSCSHFASTEGSIAHNAIFCRPGTHIEIIRKADYINFYQLAINEIANLNVTYIDAHHTTPPYGDGHIWYGPFYLCVTSCLKKWANEWTLFVPFWLHISFYWYCISRKPMIQKYISNRRIVHSMSKWLWKIRSKN